MAFGIESPLAAMRRAAQQTASSYPGLTPAQIANAQAQGVDPAQLGTSQAAINARADATRAAHLAAHPPTGVPEAAPVSEADALARQRAAGGRDSNGVPLPGTPDHARMLQEQQLAASRAPSVGVAPAQGGTSIGGAYNPAAGQYQQHAQDAQSLQVSSSIIGPNGQIMSPPSRDEQGRLGFRPGEQGFVPGTQRVNLDPYAQRLSQVGDFQAQRGMAGATLAAMPQIQANQIDRTGFNQQALEQNALAMQGQQAIGQLRGAASGMAPSAAAIQQQQGIEQAQQAQMAMAASARGGADQRAAAMRQGQTAGAQMMMQGVGQGAALRAQEMAQNRAQLVSAIGQQQQLAQGQGMNQAAVAQAQAGLGMQAQLANQQGYLGATGMDQGLVGMGAGLYQQGAGLGLAGVQFNNQAYQTDFNQQMAQKDIELQRYGIDKGVAAQRYAADQQSDAAVTGALLNAGGQLAGAGMQAFGSPRKY